MRITEVVGVVLSGFALSCCGTAPPRSQFPTADDALGRMKATFECVNGVQGGGKIDHFSPKGRIRGDLYVLAVNPDRVRFDVVSPFGATVYTLTSDGSNFEMLDLQQKQFLHGPSTPCNLARLTQVPVPGHALVALLRGEAPVLVHQKQAATIAWDTGGFYRLLVPSTREASEEIHLGIRPEDWDKPWNQQRVRVLDVRVSQRGADHYHAELRDHEPAKTSGPRVDPDGLEPDVPPSGPACDAELPRRIRMLVPSTGEDVIFTYRDDKEKKSKWNPPLLDNAFRQPVPGGVRKVFVDCGR